MPNTKKTTKITPDVSTDTLVETTTTIVEPEAITSAPVVELKKPRKFAPDEQIECRSITHGELVMEGKKTKLSYSWADAGDTAFVEYQDLQALQSTRSRFLLEPLFIIENEDLVDLWSATLKPIYDKLNEIDLDKFFKMSVGEIKRALVKAPIGLKNSVKSRAASIILSGELDSIARIKAIDEVLGTELLMMIE